MAAKERPSHSQDASTISRDWTRHGAAEIVNTDHGSRFSGKDFVEAGKASGARQSVDSKGCRRDNVFFERLSRSVKYVDLNRKA